MPRRAPKVKKVQSVQPPTVDIKDVKKRTQKKPFYRNGINKVKNDIGDVRLSDSACEQINFVIQVLARELSNDARTTCINNNKKTVSYSEIKLAVSMRFRGNLLEDIKEAIDRAIKTTKDSIGDIHDGPIRREVVAGLFFPVCLTGKFIRDFGNSSLNVGKFAPIALTATLEFVTRIILTKASERAKDDKRVTIKPRHMFLAIFDDSDLANLMHTYNIEFMGVGVRPFIHQFLKEKSLKKGKSKRKGHRAPGTVAIRKINELQRNGNLLLQKAPFGNIIKEVAQEMYGDDIRFGLWTKNVIQSFVEERVVNLIQVANEYVVMTKHEGVKDTELLNAWNVKFSWVLQTYIEASYTKIDPNTGDKIRVFLGEKGIKRLSHRAGAKSLRSNSYPVIRRFVYSLISMIVSLAIENLRYRNVITVSLSDLQMTLRVLGFNYALLPPKVKGHK